jgi:hypothetical protein
MIGDPSDDPVLGDGDYPSDVELERIRNWPLDLEDPNAGWLRLFNYINERWWMVEWGWRQKDTKARRVLSISTGGWSGNEDLLRALSENPLAWAVTWRASRRGGHHRFIISKGGKRNAY